MVSTVRFEWDAKKAPSNRRKHGQIEGAVLHVLRTLFNARSPQTRGYPLSSSRCLDESGGWPFDSEESVCGCPSWCDELAFHSAKKATAKVLPLKLIDGG